MVADPAGLISRIRSRLLPRPDTITSIANLRPDWIPEIPHRHPPVSAAVLIALVQREHDLSILYTERSSELRSHSGQIAFPGGKVDPGDRDVGDAALREAHEEVALDRREAEILGHLPLYYTGTNYLISPVVALVRPSGPFIPNPGEVNSVFEVPLGYLMVPGSFSTYRILRGEKEHSTWQINHSGLVIWGITANLTRRFHDMALSAEGG